jgi:HSP20 family molecular chaperone IbpA
MTRKDENGNIVSFSLEVVYTPFKKSDVKVKVFENVLTVTCGSENNVKDPDMIYCGISN